MISKGSRWREGVEEGAIRLKRRKEVKGEMGSRRQEEGEEGAMGLRSIEEGEESGFEWSREEQHEAWQLTEDGSACKRLPPARSLSTSSRGRGGSHVAHLSAWVSTASHQSDVVG